ncbi:MAG: RNA polymerase subunit sigma-24 [Verrucomicrobia bacterium]|nr:MAG: RNA polymerase subunit sigma-24 [Verrucomicrobiota bacterium]
MGLTPPEQASTEPAEWETIEELFSALESPLLSYALRLAGQRALAEDIVQEAFMRLHANFEQIRQPRRWLYRTVHNLALNQLRSSGKIVPLQLPEEDGPSLEPADPQPLPDEQIARMEGVGMVRLSLETLDARSREVVRLKFNEDLSYKEISARTGLSIGHVGYLLHHALKAMADELARNGVVP